MSKSLKEHNRPRLAIVIVANLAVYYWVLDHEFDFEDWKSDLSAVLQYCYVLLASIAATVLNALVNHKNKARLVFWKWKFPLPASYAFTKHIDTDPRIDKEALINRYGPFPVDPEKQNALWYKWYHEVENEVRIVQVHRDYLFTRDYTSISFLFFVTFGPLALLQIGNANDTGIYFAILLLQYVTVRWAAKNYGIRFVTSVLACKSSKIK